MTFFIGILILATIIFMMYYCIKNYNMTVGFCVASVVWVLLAIIGNAITPNAAMEGKSINDVFTAVFQTGPASFGSSVIVNVFFGAFFGVVLTETGIASTIIRKTVELGGDHPKVTVVLLGVVVAVMSISLTGIGPFIAMATIVLPIFLALGLSPLMATFALIAPGISSSFLNIIYFNQYQQMFATADPEFANFTYADWMPFGIIAFFVVLVLMEVIVCIRMNMQPESHKWAASATGASAQKNAPGYSLVAAIIPILLIMIFGLSPILSFIIASMYALATCGQLHGFKDSCRKITKYLSDGVVSVAPMIGFLLSLAMYNSAATYISPYLGAVIGGVIPTTALGIVIFFCVFSFLGHFRGPINIVGSGIALLNVVVGLRTWPTVFLYPLFIIPTIMTTGLDVTLSSAVWALDYTKAPASKYMRWGIAASVPTCIILELIVFFMYGSLV